MGGADRQATDALAGSGENRIGQRRRHRWHARFTDTGRALLAGNDVHFDGRRLVHANDLVVVEITLPDATADELREAGS